MDESITFSAVEEEISTMDRFNEQCKEIMRVMLPRHVVELAEQMYQIDYPMGAACFVMGMVMLTYEQANFAMANAMIQPEWESGEIDADTKFRCGKCGMEAPKKRPGQMFCSNECGASLPANRKRKKR